MRPLFTAFITALLLVAAGTVAVAEKRIFIIATSPDIDGLDRCLANGTTCSAAAAAYCQAKHFATAASYRKIERDEITGAIPVSTACGRKSCGEFVAIECAR